VCTLSCILYRHTVIFNLCCTDEVDLFLKQPRVASEENPYTFWKSNAQAFPVLAQLARRYLAPRASSVDNERVFSGTGRLLEPKRNRLTAKNGSMLAFLYHNICEIDMEYDWPK
jgi:hypothetical protein